MTLVKDLWSQQALEHSFIRNIFPAHHGSSTSWLNEWREMYEMTNSLMYLTYLLMLSVSGSEKGFCPW